jgi:hypothetical protein
MLIIPHPTPCSIFEGIAVELIRIRQYDDEHTLFSLYLKNISGTVHSTLSRSKFCVFRKRK